MMLQLGEFQFTETLATFASRIFDLKDLQSYLARILINTDWCVSPETRILKCFLNYPIGQLYDFCFCLILPSTIMFFFLMIRLKISMIELGKVFS